MFEWLKQLLDKLGMGDTPPPEPQPAPPEALPPAPAPGAPPPIDIGIERRDTPEGPCWFAQLDGSDFVVGRDVRYGARRGLMLLAPAQGYLKFEPDAWRGEYGVWADLIGVTSNVEGARDLTPVNSYDTAAFTFGLMQWGAHTPGDNFVLLLRRLLALPKASYYFPDLALDGEGRIAKRNGEIGPLEAAASTASLQNYLNPDADAVGAQEVMAAAKLIHWIKNDEAARDTLIRFAFDHYRALVKEVSAKVGLDKKTDVEVMLCADIRHQGRGTYEQMRTALAHERSVDKLLEIGAGNFAKRVAGLRTQILEAQLDGRLGTMRYVEADNAFVPAPAPPPPKPWPEAHIERKRSVTDRNDTVGAHKLTEPGAPTRNAGADTGAKVEALRAIALWLDPKRSKRYERAGRTRCNIYAYDFATLAGGYLPRVWWTGEAIADIEAGKEVVAEYGKNVAEVSANGLMVWFNTQSARYGWRPAPDTETLQKHADAGGLAVIVARNKDPAASGHITIVVPENSVDQEGNTWTARKVGAEMVPVQSQAGAANFSFGCGNAWWKYSYMAEHGFWIHD